MRSRGVVVIGLLAAFASCEPEGTNATGQARESLTSQTAKRLASRGTTVRAGYQEEPLGLASNGSGFLVCWRETSENRTRCTATDAEGFNENADPAPLPDTGPGQFAAWHRGEYLVMAAARAGPGGDYLATRLDDGGTALGTRVILSWASQQASSPAILSVSGSLVLAWSQAGSVMAAISNDDGGLVSAPLALSAGGSGPERPALAAAGNRVLAAWVQGQPDAGTVIAGNVFDIGTGLTSLGNFTFPGARGQALHPTVASNGTEFFIAWDDGFQLSETDIYGARVSTNGTVVDSAPIALVSGPDNQSGPNALGFGSEFLLAWVEGIFPGSRPIRAMRFAVPTSPGLPTLISPDSFQDATLAFNGSNAMLIWESLTGVDGTRLDFDGGIRHPGGRAIALGPSFEEQPKIAFGADRFFIAWLDDRLVDGGAGRGTGLYLTRLDADGNPLDAQPTTITDHSLTSGHDLSFDGQQFVLKWYEPGPGLIEPTTRVTRIRPDGTLLDPGGFTLDAGGGVTLGCGGGRCLGAPCYAEDGQWLFPDGTTTRTPRVQLVGQMFCPRRVLFGGDRFFVVWTGPTLRSNVSVVTSAQGYVGPVTDAGRGLSPTLVVGPDRELTFDTPAFEPHFFVRQLDRDLLARPEPPLEIAANTLDAIAGVWTGQSYALVWKDFGALHGLELTPAGGVLPDSGFDALTGDDAGVRTRSIEVAWGTTRGVAVIEDINVRATRSELTYRVLTSALPPPVDAGSSGSDGGFGADGGIGEQTDGGTGTSPPAGCSCNSAPLVNLAALGVLLLLRRRRG